MAKPEFYAAGYMFIENDKWEYLFMKRANTGFRDGAYQVPAGHLEWEESMIDCIKREAKEELDIDIKDCKIVHISHRIAPNRVYFDFYAKVISYGGELKINEPQKCSELKFIDINNISDKEKDLFSYDLDIIKKIENWECFSEIK